MDYIDDESSSSSEDLNYPENILRNIRSIPITTGLYKNKVYDFYILYEANSSDLDISLPEEINNFIVFYIKNDIIINMFKSFYENKYHNNIKVTSELSLRYLKFSGPFNPNQLHFLYNPQIDNNYIISPIEIYLSKYGDINENLYIKFERNKSLAINSNILIEHKHYNQTGSLKYEVIYSWDFDNGNQLKFTLSRNSWIGLSAPLYESYSYDENQQLLSYKERKNVGKLGESQESLQKKNEQEYIFINKDKQEYMDYNDIDFIIQSSEYVII